jgi:glycosyltransferase involved in cell wall biosynthesis
MSEVMVEYSDPAGLRVLLVTPRYFPETGGVENHVFQVARRLARANTDVTVLTTDRSGQLPPRETLDGVQIIRARAWPAERDYYYAPEIPRIIRTGGWDVMHVQSYHTLVAPMAMAAALQAQVPYAVTFHGGGHSIGFRNQMRSVQQQMLRPLLARAARLVATARFEIEQFGTRLGIPHEKFVFIPNGADIGAPAPSVRPTIRTNRIASIGRLERYKGHQRILAAMPHILKQCPDANLWIAGTGPYEGELRRLARTLQVEDHVDIRSIPADQRDRMAAELATVSVAVLMSEYETHPMAVIEAIAMGCSALVADTSGLSELAQQGSARAIPLNSAPQHVADATLELLRTPLTARQLEMPTWDGCVAQLLAMYRHMSQHSKKSMRRACVS